MWGPAKPLIEQGLDSGSFYRMEVLDITGKLHPHFLDDIYNVVISVYRLFIQLLPLCNIVTSVDTRVSLSMEISARKRSKSKARVLELRLQSEFWNFGFFKNNNNKNKNTKKI